MVTKVSGGFGSGLLHSKLLGRCPPQSWCAQHPQECSPRNPPFSAGCFFNFCLLKYVCFEASAAAAVAAASDPESEVKSKKPNRAGSEKLGPVPLATSVPPVASEPLRCDSALPVAYHCFLLLHMLPVASYF